MKERIRHLEGLQEANLPADEYEIIHSAWLALMGLRPNGDLDIIISSKLRRERFSEYDANVTFGIPGALERRIRVHPANSPYGQIFGMKDIDDVIYHHFLEIDGLHFVEPRFYFEIKRQRLEQLVQKQKSLPWWKRWLLRGYSEKKLSRKIRKDRDDLVLVDRFFAEGKHKTSKFNNISEEAWGTNTFKKCPVSS